MGGEFSQNSAALKRWASKAQTNLTINMIHFVDVVLKDIFEHGRDYPWVRPDKCFKCGHYKVWGHGFVPRLFDDFPSPLLIKCYRCPNCHCVITLRPVSHFSRIQSAIETIRSRLQYRLEKGRWGPLTLPTSRYRHWLANLRRRIKAYLTEKWSQGEMAAFDWFITRGQVPVSVI